MTNAEDNLPKRRLNRPKRRREPTNISGWLKTGSFAHHVLRVERDGVRGALKRPRITPYRDRNGRVTARFHDEIDGLIQLSDRAGILPVIDSDHDANPPWFVTPEATLLSTHLGSTPNLRDVIEAFADLAQTLADLQSDGIAHRDIKPDNLFWYNNRAVFGDFGIATWPNRDANLTAIGEKVGSAHFLAPEVRAVAGNVDYFPADIWSLVKALHVIANPADGPYPPGGTHYHGVAEFSLQAAGSGAAAELEWLLECCTDIEPTRRPTADDFTVELRAWLDKHPAGTVERFTPPEGVLTWGNPFAQADWRRFQQIEELVELQIVRAAIATLEGVDDNGCEMPSVNDEYPYTDAFDHFISHASGVTSDGRRAAFAALMWMSAGTEFRVEIQQIDGDNITVLDVRKSDTVQPEWPSGQRIVDHFVSWARTELSIDQVEG